MNSDTDRQESNISACIRSVYYVYSYSKSRILDQVAFGNTCLLFDPCDYKAGAWVIGVSKQNQMLLSSIVQQVVMHYWFRHALCITWIPLACNCEQIKNILIHTMEAFSLFFFYSKKKKKGIAVGDIDSFSDVTKNSKLNYIKCRLSLQTGMGTTVWKQVRKKIYTMHFSLQTVQNVITKIHVHTLVHISSSFVSMVEKK